MPSAMEITNFGRCCLWDLHPTFSELDYAQYHNPAHQIFRNERNVSLFFNGEKLPKIQPLWCEDHPQFLKKEILSGDSEHIRNI